MYRLLLLSLLLGSAARAASDDPPLLLRYPTLSQTSIVFNYAGDLWIVSREGGDARQLTSGVGNETVPHFSPDGSLIAFTGEYDGNRDVFVMPSSGGVPRRLTFHPADETVLGWSPDGTRVLFSSTGNTFRFGANQLFTVPVSGGFPTQLPLPIGEGGSFAPDGQRLAYIPFGQWHRAWKRYHGGQTTPIWLADLRDSSVRKVPRENSNDYDPMWVGDTVYFLSDRAGPVSLFAYDVKLGKVTEALHCDGRDFKTADAGPGAIVIEQFGAIKLYDLRTREARNVSIRVRGDFAAVRPHVVSVKPNRIANFNVSPTGVRAVFEAWGEIFTVPTDKGEIRNLTNSPAVADRSPAWSPDGRFIAYFSDASGEYELHIRDQSGRGEARRIALGTSPTFFYDPHWSPDSRKIAYADKHLGLWYVDVQAGKPKRIDEQYFATTSAPEFAPAWSPDSQWLAYTKNLRNGLYAVFVYSLAQGKSFQITDGMSDARYPAFDRNGKYLYFTASTDVGLTVQRLDMSSNEHPLTRSVYVVVLSKSGPSPIPPLSDEEKAAVEKPAIEKPPEDPNQKNPTAPLAAAKAKTPEAQQKSVGGGAAGGGKTPVANDPSMSSLVRIDMEDIGQRILALPIPAKNYTGLQAGKSGVLFLSEGPPIYTDSREVPQSLQKFDLSKRRIEKLVDEVNTFVVSFDGEKILYRNRDSWQIAAADGPPRPGVGPLRLDGWEVFVEPRAMWAQMYGEAWRIERDFFYDPGYHGLDLAKAKRRYEPYLAGIASRDELTYLLNEALGELTVGHLQVGGGEQPDVKKVKGGLLGADYTLENGRYRIARVFGSGNWNPDLRAPLTQPGNSVNVGDYILAVNSRELRSSDNIYEFLEGTAGKQVSLTVGPRPDDSGSHTVTVVPIESELGLRALAWVDSNFRRVDEATGGRVAYVSVPDTASIGYASFNRYFFSQVGKEAVIVDGRFNGGGKLPDYVIDYLRRPLLNRFANRDGADWSSPARGIYGPKVMLINQSSGSGGDALALYFRKAGLGPLIGTRTWGGLTGPFGDPPRLIDGGSVSAPSGGFYGLNGEWEIENHGIAPDIEVDLEPQAFRAGRDVQLEKAVEVVMRELKEHPVPQPRRPAFPNYHEHDGLGRNP